MQALGLAPLAASRLDQVTVKEVVERLLLFNFVYSPILTEREIAQSACEKVVTILNQSAVATVADTSAAASLATTNIDIALDEAWAVLQNPKQVKDQTALFAYLSDECGVEEKSDLKYLKQDIVQVIVSQHLKPVGGGKFLEAMSKFLNV